MKVLHLPHYRGVTPYVSRLTDELAPFGVQVLIWHPTGSLPMLSALLRHGRPDILHLHWLHEQIMGHRERPSGFRMLRLAAELKVFRLLGVRVVWTIHNLRAHETTDPETELRFNGWIARRLCDRLIVHSEAARAAVVSAYRLPTGAAEKIAVVPHPGVAGHYPTGVSREQARRRFGLGNGDRVFLFVGKVRNYKGVNRALDVFRRIPGERLRFIIAGSPKPLEVGNRLRNTCNDPRVILKLALVPSDEIQVYMAAADVVVCPFLRVLTSGSLLLAMSFGKPVVVPELDVIRDVVDEEGAIFFDPGSDADLERAFRRAASLDSASLLRMGEWNSVRARKDGEVGRLTSAVYKGCLSRARAFSRDRP